MLPFSYIALGLAIHLVFDWFLQPREMAKCKSTNWRCLLGHAVIVGAGTLLFFSLIASPFTHLFVWLGIAYTALHAIQDRTIWCLYARTAAARNVENILDDNLFFTTIGIDQTLHLLVLFYFVSLLI